MLLKLSWRNIWRNKRRSLVVLTSIIVGVMAALLMDAFQNGTVNQMLFNQVKLTASHIQIHHKGFKDNKSVHNYIENSKQIESVLKNEPNIQYFSKRILTFGLISSTDNSAGIFLYGIDPKKEENITILKESIVEGEYLGNGEREIIMGVKLAKKLKVTLGDKVVAMANNPDGSIASELFRISGLFNTASSDFDKSYIFVHRDMAEKMLNLSNKIHEFAIIANDYNKSESIASSLQSKLGKEYEVLPYTKILPSLAMQLDMYKQTNIIINIIIALALIFGIINSMLMAVYERIREIGVLMSIGMKNIQIFSTILIEAFILGIAGTILGILFGYLFFQLFLSNGIDFSAFSQSLSSWGIGSIVYPQFSLDNLIQILILIPFVSVIGAIYPALKAIRLQPVNAIRYV